MWVAGEGGWLLRGGRGDTEAEGDRGVWDRGQEQGPWKAEGAKDRPLENVSKGPD